MCVYNLVGVVLACLGSLSFDQTAETDRNEHDCHSDEGTLDSSLSKTDTLYTTTVFVFCVNADNLRATLSANTVVRGNAFATVVTTATTSALDAEAAWHGAVLDRL